MTYAEFPPSPQLAPYIECYWSVSFTQSPFQPLEILIPDARTEIIFNYGYSYKKYSDHQRKSYHLIPGSHFIGIRERAIFLESMDGVRFFAIRFRPGGILPFLQIPARELAQQYIDLELLFGSTAREMEERIFEAPTRDQKIQVTEQMLLSKLKELRPVTCSLDAALRDIYASKGMCTIDQLSATYNIGYKKLERYFHKHVGCSPKSFMKMVRFTHAVHMLQTHQEANMTEIAYETGYYDQSHFNRDFKFFAGTNPKEFRQRQYTISRVIRPKVTYQPPPCYYL